MLDLLDLPFYFLLLRAFVRLFEKLRFDSYMIR